VNYLYECGFTPNANQQQSERAAHHFETKNNAERRKPTKITYRFHPEPTGGSGHGLRSNTQLLTLLGIFPEEPNFGCVHKNK
jgi:hypothetical protein